VDEPLPEGDPELLPDPELPPLDPLEDDPLPEPDEPLPELEGPLPEPDELPLLPEPELDEALLELELDDELLLLLEPELEELLLELVTPIRATTPPRKIRHSKNIMALFFRLLSLN
jgi:hypothetical protein